MSMEYIRKYYNVPAKRGGRVEYTGCGQPERGTITSADGAQLCIRLDGLKHPAHFHPTWKLRYLQSNACEITGCEAVRLIDGLELNFERKTYGKRNISSQSKCALCKHRTVETRMGSMVSFRRRRS